MAGKENTLQEFGKYVSQSVLSQLGVSCYILADTYFISKGVGADGLTALNLAIPVFSVMNGCGFMLGIGSGTKYGIMKGTGNEKRGDVLFTSSLCGDGAGCNLYADRSAGSRSDYGACGS